MSQEQIETERLLIRPLEVSDASPLAAIWSDPAVTRHMGGPRNFVELRDQLEADARGGSQAQIDLWPVVERSSGRVIGHCGFVKKDVDGQTEIELTYVFESQSWGKGHATEAASALRDHAFQQMELRRIIALIDPENRASRRVAEKIGMSFERETTRPSGKVLRVYAMEADRGANRT